MKESFVEPLKYLIFIKTLLFIRVRSYYILLHNKQYNVTYRNFILIFFVRNYLFLGSSSLIPEPEALNHDKTLQVGLEIYKKDKRYF